MLLALLLAILPPGGAQAVQTVGVVTTQHPTTLKADTRFNATLNTTIDSTVAQPGDNFSLTVNDPSYPVLQGAKITGHLTKVEPSRGVDPASITFLFDTITFQNGKRQPFRGWVVNARVTHHTAGTPPPAAGAMPMGTFAPSPSTIVWKMDIGRAAKPTAQTGGHGYAAKAGVPIHVDEGTAVTLMLASDLNTP